MVKQARIGSFGADKGLVSFLPQALEVGSPVGLPHTTTCWQLTSQASKVPQVLQHCAEGFSSSHLMMTNGLSDSSSSRPCRMSLRIPMGR